MLLSPLATLLLVTQSPKPAPLKPVKNVVAGRVVNASGKPLANVTVGIYGTTNAGENTRFEAITNAAGLYRQRVPAGIYGASAYYETTYRGDNFKFTLTPNDGITAKQHDSEPGVVKHFTWRISGLKPGQRAGQAGSHTEQYKYYGNSVQVKMREEGFTSFKYPAGSSVELVFVPNGPLIDGTQGKPQKRTFAFPEETSASSRYLYATDLPVGAYTATATFVRPDGTRSPLPLQVSGDLKNPMKAALDLPFHPTQFGDLQQAYITLDIPKS
ncbi:carboxypeptidase regulatory-like domain-containing protein [bacterium]|nr:MAG: carboxypeptidase regulatory-like domain-containing protein [bacterium]